MSLRVPTTASTARIQLTNTRLQARVRRNTRFSSEARSVSVLGGAMSPRHRPCLRHPLLRLGLSCVPTRATVGTDRNTRSTATSACSGRLVCPDTSSMTPPPFAHRLVDVVPCLLCRDIMSSPYTPQSTTRKLALSLDRDSFNHDRRDLRKRFFPSSSRNARSNSGRPSSNDAAASSLQSRTFTKSSSSASTRRTSLMPCLPPSLPSACPHLPHRVQGATSCPGRRCPPASSRRCDRRMLPPPPTAASSAAGDRCCSPTRSRRRQSTSR